MFLMDLRAVRAEHQSVLTFLVFLHLANAHAVVIGDHAPGQPLVGVTGESIRLVSGEVTAVTFFATWCEPCHKAISDLLEIRRARRGFRILLIAVGEPVGKVEAFRKAQAIPADVWVAVDSTAEAARAWGQDRFPTTFLVDREGVIRRINRGYGSGFRTRVERWLRGMLAARSLPRWLELAFVENGACFN
jgi:thiol-disulfide isomerase/thioredoxin